MDSIISTTDNELPAMNSAGCAFILNLDCVILNLNFISDVNTLAPDSADGLPRHWREQRQHLVEAFLPLSFWPHSACDASTLLQTYVTSLRMQVCTEVRDQVSS